MKSLTKLFVLAFSLILGIAAATGVLADQWTESSIDISELTVYANGNPVWYGYCAENGDSFCLTYQYAVPALERDSVLSVRAVFKAANDVNNVRVKAWIYGYRESIEDRTSEFDIFRGMQYSKTLVLTVPEDIDAREDFTLYVKIEAKKELKGVDEAKIDTSIQRIADKLKILSFNLWSSSASKVFKAGTTMYADVVVKNSGNHLAEDVFVKLRIPDLRLERTVYIGDIGSYDNGYEDTVKTTISLRLPEDAKSGNYKVIVQAFNSKLNAEATQIAVVEGLEKPEDEADERKTEKTADQAPFNWENLLMVISIALAVAIIVLLVLMLVKQKPSEEKLEEAESYY